MSTGEVRLPGGPCRFDIVKSFHHDRAITFGGNEPGVCTARQWSRAGVTPHGPNYDCRLRGSAADTQSTKPEKVAIRCDNIGAKQKRD
jgi:hypothetical protein